jgi:hypothetical protein
VTPPNARWLYHGNYPIAQAVRRRSPLHDRSSGPFQLTTSMHCPKVSNQSEDIDQVAGSGDSGKLERRYTTCDSLG